MRYIYIHTYRQNTHTHKINKFKKDEVENNRGRLLIPKYTNGPHAQSNKYRKKINVTVLQMRIVQSEKIMH